MIEAFLICALSLRPVSFPPIHDDKFVQEFADSFPGEVWLIKGYELPSDQFEKVNCIKYRGYSVYLKKSS